MKLDYPLFNLIEVCKTQCDPECCGIHAFDFLPINIAYYFSRYVTKFNKNEAQIVISQLEQLRSTYGKNSLFSDDKILIEQVNHFFTKDDVELLVAEILENIEISEALVNSSEVHRKNITLNSIERERIISKKRHKNPDPKLT